MKRPNRKKNARFKTEASLTPVKHDIKPENLVAFVPQAEKEILPLIESWELSAGAAIFLLAQRVQTLATGIRHLESKSATNLIYRVLELWKSGLYQPSTQYPFTLNETLLDLKNSKQPPADYSAYFQPFTPTSTVIPKGTGQIAGGIVQHPQTHLWQVWIVAGSKRSFLGAYHDPLIAQKNLEIVVNTVRQTGQFDTSRILHEDLLSQTDGEPEQIPFAMMVYLTGHLHLYTIKL